MIARNRSDVWLFSYGTLRQTEVQLGTFGRRLDGRPDALPGYISQLQEVADPNVIELSGTAHHPSLVKTGNSSDEVPGWAFIISKAEIAMADAYEAASNYRRVRVRLKSGHEAFTYIHT